MATPVRGLPAAPLVSPSVCGTNDGRDRVEAQGHLPAEPLPYIYLPVPAYVPIIAATALKPAPVPAPPAARPMCALPAASPVYGPLAAPSVYASPATPTACVCAAYGNACPWTTRGTACSWATRGTAYSSIAWDTTGADRTCTNGDANSINRADASTKPRGTCRTRDVQQRAFFGMERAQWNGTSRGRPEGSTEPSKRTGR